MTASEDLAALGQAWHLLSIERYDRALATVSRPGLADHAEARRLRAFAHAGADRRTEAIRLAQRALADGEDPSLLGLLASLVEEEGDAIEAERLLLRGLALWPESPGLLCGYALLTARAGETDKSSVLVERARRVSPASAEVESVAAAVAHLAGDDRSASAAATAAMSLDPSVPAARHALLMVHVERGDLAPARKLADGLAADRPGDREAVAMARAIRDAHNPWAAALRASRRVPPLAIWLGAIVLTGLLSAAGQDLAAGVVALAYVLFAVATWVGVLVLDRRGEGRP